MIRRSSKKSIDKILENNKSWKILDIGCGRGKIIGSLSSKLKLRNKPIGIDLVSHKDKDMATKFELNYFINRLVTLLEEKNFFNPEER